MLRHDAGASRHATRGRHYAATLISSCYYLRCYARWLLRAMLLYAIVICRLRFTISHATICRLVTLLPLVYDIVDC